LLTLTPHKIVWWTIIYSKWIPLLNPYKLARLKVLIWGTFHMLPLRVDINNNRKKDSHFYITLNFKGGWLTHLFIIKEEDVLFFLSRLTMIDVQYVVTFALILTIWSMDV
jgi:hypothetical protein